MPGVMLDIAQGDDTAPTQAKFAISPRCPAKLTGMVNIAVFAAFCWCVGGALLSNPEMKRLCRDRRLDAWRYGWQKRQETARWVAKTAKVRGVSAVSPLPRAQ